MTIPATDANIVKARAFVLRKWRERAAEMNLPMPRTAQGACKFASMFAAAVFDGELRGHYRHQWAEVDGQVIDLAVKDGPYEHDAEFFGNEDHAESMALCAPRVANWVTEFLDGWIESFKVHLGYTPAGRERARYFPSRELAADYIASTRIKRKLSIESVHPRPNKRK